MNTILKRHASRRIGADMTNALLWAAFAIAVLISILGMYQIIQMNSNKTEATRTISMVSSEVRSLYQNRTNFDSVSAQSIIDAGGVPVGVVQNNQITLPYGGVVDVSGSADTFEIDIAYADATRGAQALCVFLVSGFEASGQMIEAGPLGSNYTLASNACADDAFTIEVSYER